MIPGLGPLPAQISLPSQPLAAAGISSDVAIGRLPFSEVSASVALPEPNNNSRGAAQTHALAQVDTTPSLAASLNASAQRAPSQPLNFGFSSLFLAQLLGQTSTAESNQIASFFSQPSPAFTGNPVILELFSRVKYKPSNASVPPPPAPTFSQAAAPAPDPLLVQRIEAARPAPVQNVQATAPVASATANAVSAQPAASVQVSQVSEPARADQRQQTARTQKPTASARPPSLITPRGIDAYLATFSRNHANTNAQDAVQVSVA